MKKCIVLLLFLFMYFHSGYAPVKPAEQKKADIENFLEAERIRELKLFISTAPFSKELCKIALRIYVQHPEIVYRQAILETNHFTSKLFLKYGNLSGMKYPAKRKTTSIGKIRVGKIKNYAEYAHWLDSIRDLALWQDYYRKAGYDLSNYYSFLATIPYATDKKYVTKLKKIQT